MLSPLLHHNRTINGQRKQPRQYHQRSGHPHRPDKAVTPPGGRGSVRAVSMKRNMNRGFPLTGQIILHDADSRVRVRVRLRVDNIPVLVHSNLFVNPIPARAHRHHPASRSGLSIFSSMLRGSDGAEPSRKHVQTKQSGHPNWRGELREPVSMNRNMNRAGFPPTVPFILHDSDLRVRVRVRLRADEIPVLVHVPRTLQSLPQPRPARARRHHPLSRSVSFMFSPCSAVGTRRYTRGYSGIGSLGRIAFRN
jgi:hypothetical protein